eukprot:gene32444-40043_t
MSLNTSNADIEQVLAKSCKIIPVMLIGLLMGNAVSYPLWDYIEAFLLTAGVTSFTLTQKASKNSHSDSWYGVGLLACYLL